MISVLPECFRSSTERASLWDIERLTVALSDQVGKGKRKSLDFVQTGSCLIQLLKVHSVSVDQPGGRFEDGKIEQGQAQDSLVKCLVPEFDRFHLRRVGASIDKFEDPSGRFC